MENDQSGGGWRMALVSTCESGGVGRGPGVAKALGCRWDGAREILCCNCCVDLLS